MGYVIKMRRVIKMLCPLVTDPPTHSVGVQTSNGRVRLSSSSVTLHGGPAGGFTRAGQAMTSCRLQSNYSFMATLHGGPVVLHSIRVKPCYMLLLQHEWSSRICGHCRYDCDDAS